jgi:hypothetical protein
LSETVSLETARGMLEVLRGKAAWDVARAAGSWLSFYFGKKLVDSRGILSGEWGLYVYAPWIIQTEQVAIVSSNDRQGFMDKVLLKLQGIPVADISVKEVSFDMTLNFENGFQLRVFPVHAEERQFEMPYWMFAHDAHFIIAFDSKQRIEYSDLRKPDDPK